jgi:hypothetical protein
MFTHFQKSPHNLEKWAGATPFNDLGFVRKLTNHGFLTGKIPADFPFIQIHSYSPNGPPRKIGQYNPLYPACSTLTSL